MERRIETLRLHQNTYPRDPAPVHNLAVAYNSLGRFDEALQRARLAVRFEPPAGNRWTVLGNALLGLGGFNEAGEAYRQALALGRNSPSPHQGLFRVAFVQGDEAGMTREVDWAVRGGAENNALDWQGAAAAFHGQHSRSQQFARRISESVADREAAGAAAGMIAQAAVRASALGRCLDATGNARRALSIERDPVSLTRSALALAWCGQSGEATALVEWLAIDADMLSDPSRQVFESSVDVPISRHESALAGFDERKRAKARPRSAFWRFTKAIEQVG